MGSPRLGRLEAISPCQSYRLVRVCADAMEKAWGLGVYQKSKRETQIDLHTNVMPAFFIGIRF